MQRYPSLIQIGEQLIEPVTPPPVHHAGNILEGDMPRPQLLDQARVLPRQAVPDTVHRSLRCAPAEDGEALARRASEQQRQLADADASAVQQVTSCDLADVPGQWLDAHVRGIGGGRVAVDLDGTDDLEAGLLEPDRSAPTPAKRSATVARPVMRSPRCLPG